ncbi:glycosyltransferase [Clostridium estertheticum]|uniref:glycosyltransferase n=1 Tax=Clostridium estertheticum TaxID=238834 RepID=UPI001CF5B83D|nr:glycosyltransferase [Clostridium estertheticum]MCB2357870.1 glycosyltransferase [Clostridium estertheticum]
MSIFSFVILNYNNYKDTEDCVLSIIDNIKYDSFYIVLVDNGSTDNSEKKLKSKFKNHSKIILISNKENLGFSKGNNIGYIYAKYNLKSNFICYLNNDTIISDYNFINKIYDIYSENKFDVLGPDIINLEGRHTNPYAAEGYSLKEINKFIFKFRCHIILNKINLDGLLILLISKMKKNHTDKIEYNCELSGIKLHGACLIFSKKYIDNFEGISEYTFLYFEEDILYFSAKKNHLKVIYNPSISILHKEGSTAKKLFKKNKLSEAFYYKQCLKSLKILRNILKKDCSCLLQKTNKKG